MNRSLSRTVGSRRQLTGSECRHRLPTHHEGRIGYLSGQGWRSVVVSYCTRDDAVLIRLPDCHDAVHYAPGQEVVFDVCETGTEPGRLDEIQVRGPASLLERDREPGDAFGEPSWPGSAMHVLSVGARDISGFTEPE